VINKRFDLIEKSDIDSLIVNQVPENRTIDYKEELPGNTDNDKKEFLADISSFANASGGDIIYGIQEKRDSKGQPTGLPESSKGLNGINTDAEIRRLENIIRDNIAPRIMGIQITAVEGFTKGAIIIIRIPRSFASPHMVTFKKHSRFYSRNSAGKYPLDVTEIRSAFALSEALPERIRNFRYDRISKVIADEAPVRLISGPKIILHLLPIASLDSVTQIDIISAIKQRSVPAPIGTTGWNYRYNFDGFLHYSNSTQRAATYAYLQVFRSGAIESVYVFSETSQKIIPSQWYEQQLILALQQYLATEMDWGLNPPFFIMLSLIGVKDYEVSTKRINLFPLTSYEIDRDILLLPEVLVEEYAVKAADILRPLFDAIWQSAGWDCCKNYDKDGNWGGQ